MQHSQSAWLPSFWPHHAESLLFFCWKLLFCLLHLPLESFSHSSDSSFLCVTLKPQTYYSIQKPAKTWRSKTSAWVLWDFEVFKYYCIELFCLWIVLIRSLFESQQGSWSFATGCQVLSGSAPKLVFFCFSHNPCFLSCACDVAFLQHVQTQIPFPLTSASLVNPRVA